MMARRGVDRSARRGLLQWAGLTLSALLTAGALISTDAFAAQICATPGKDGPTVTGGTYYPSAAASASTGTTSVNLGAARVDASASITPITAGDLVMVIQMQDASINNSNSIAYGDGSSGAGFTALNNAGVHEFKVVQSVSGSVLTFATPLVNTYTNTAATSTAGKKSFQIVRVPQYSSVTISGTVNVPAWDGSTGGVFAIDVAGTLTLNGTINASGVGFRGGGSVQSSSLSGQNLTDYATAFVAVNGANHGGFKGEGIAGTPRYVRGTSTTTAFNGVDLGSSGYPNSLDIARGAPGNAGGGGTQHNAGGGGGSNIGFGGLGGRTYGVYSATNTGATCVALTSGATTYYSCNGDGSRLMGGLGGVAQTASLARLFMGGGGGAGDNNNAADDNPTVPQSSGGAGGGLIFIRAGALAGSGALLADGQAGQATGRDGAGGGGGGGTIVIQTNPGSYSITASAKGGAGGNSGGPLHAGETEGPGGGGGGGGVLLSTGVSIGAQTVTAGTPGVNNPSGSLTNNYGSASGSGGIGNFPTTLSDTLASSCLPSVTVTKAATPGSVVNSSAGASASYTVVISNAANLGTARNVVLNDALPTGFTYASGATVTLSGGATGSSPPVNSGTTTTPILGTYDLPSGGSIQLVFPTAIASSVAPGTYPNTGHAKYDDPLRTAAGAQVDVASNVANVTVYNAPTGTVYADANHDGALNGGEAGTGLSGLYVKIAPTSGGVCQSPATQAVAVDGTTGAYAITAALTSGDYCLILDNNNTLSDITPSTPSGWIGTEAASGIRTVTVGSSVIAPSNFGLFHGSTLTGRVFSDIGSGGGTANDGVQNGGEAGIAGAAVSALSGASIVASATTTSSGDYTLWLPSTVSGAVGIVEALPQGWLASGGSAGTTAGAYVRTTNTSTFTFASGQTYSGVNFGNVPVNVLNTDGAQTGQPSSALYYPHSFLAGSAGQVTFSTVGVSNPSMFGWAESILYDANCSGTLDTGDVPLTGPLTVTAGQTVCVLVREFIPANAPLNASSKVTLSAAFSYSGASPALNATLTRTDLTTVGAPGDLMLVKQVRNVTHATAFGTANSALPGETLEYQLQGTNQGSNALGTLVLNDSTPAYTTFVSAACPGTLPAGLTACAVTTQPTVGAQGTVKWTFTGTMNPGGQIAVTYQVKVAQ